MTVTVGRGARLLNAFFCFYQVHDQNPHWETQFKSLTKSCWIEIRWWKRAVDEPSAESTTNLNNVHCVTQSTYTQNLWWLEANHLYLKCLSHYQCSKSWQLTQKNWNKLIITILKRILRCNCSCQSASDCVMRLWHENALFVLVGPTKFRITSRWTSGRRTTDSAISFRSSFPECCRGWRSWRILFPQKKKVDNPHH